MSFSAFRFPFWMKFGCFFFNYIAIRNIFEIWKDDSFFNGKNDKFQ